MTGTDVQHIIGWIDSSLELFRNNQGRLSAREIRILSMLTVAREELTQSLERESLSPLDPLRPL